MKSDDDRERSSVILVLAGLFLGAGLTLLLTPKSGKQMRRDLNRRAMQARNSVEETVGKVKEQGKEVLEVAEEAIHEAKHAFNTERAKSNK